MFEVYKTSITGQFKEERFKNGYLWLFSNEIIKKNLPNQICFVNVYDKKGKFLCKGVYNPYSLISLRILSFSEEENIDKNFFINKIKRALSLRENFGLDINYCRILYGESDLLPGLVIDRYGDVFVVQFFSFALEIFKEEIVNSLLTIFRPSQIIIRNDFYARNLENASQDKQVVYSKTDEKYILINHLGLKFIVDVLNGQKTGFYYDQKDNRIYLSSLVKEKKVLDLCCYTGSFSIIAKKYGAKKVVGVDSSSGCLDIAKENAKINNVEVEFVHAEVEKFLELNREKYDIVIFDPPSYTRSKKDIKKAKKKYKAICKQILKNLNSNGIFIFCVCAQHISWQDVKEIVKDSMLKINKKGFILYYGKQSLDHPIYIPMQQETEYLKCVTVQVI